MFSKIKSLFRHTVIYGLGNFISRGISFLLLPLLTNSMTPAEYGKLAVIQTFIGLAEVFFAAGMRPAVLRYANKPPFTREQSFTAGIFWILLASVIGVILLTLFSPRLLPLMGLDSSLLYRYIMIILVLDALSIPAYALLQIREKAFFYALLKVVNVSIYFGGCLYLVVMKDQADVGAVLLANAAASASLILLCLPLILGNLRRRLPRGLLTPMLKFGLPYVPNVLFVVTMDMVNRLIISRLLGLEAAGYFTAAIKLALIMFLVVYAFQTAWQPFFLSHLDDPGGGRLFARVFTYYLLATSLVFLVIGLFYNEIASLHYGKYMLIGREYHQGLNIIPVVLLAYIFTGMYSNFIVGIYAKEKTLWIPLITFAGAVVNVTANFLLIPVMGLMGAALATLLSYVTITVILYPVSQRLFAVHYEWKRLIKIALCAGAVFLAGSLCGPAWARLLVILSFIPLLLICRAFEKEEILKLRNLIPAR